MLPAANTPIPFQKPPLKSPASATTHPTVASLKMEVCQLTLGSLPAFFLCFSFPCFFFSFFKPLHTYIWLMLLFSTFLCFIAWWTQNLPLICWQHVISSTQGWQAIFYLNYCKPVCCSRGRWMCLTPNFPLNGELYVPLRKAFQENTCWKMPSSLTVNGCKSISG